MGAATGPQFDRRVHLGGPHPARIDHRAGPQIEGLPGQLVGQPHRGAGRLGRADPGEHPGTVPGRGACDGHHQPGVIDQLAVEGQQCAVETVTADRRRHRDRLLRADPPWPRQHRGLGAGQQPQHVAGLKPHPHQRTLTAAHRRQQRHQLRHRTDQVRCRPGHQDAPLDSTAPRDPDVAGGEITQPAVHQLRTPPAGAEGQIVFVHQHHGEAAAGRVQSNSGAGDPGADDDHVDGGGVPECGEVGAAPRGIECGQFSHSGSRRGMRSRHGTVRHPVRRRPESARRSAPTARRTA